MQPQRRTWIPACAGMTIGRHCNHSNPKMFAIFLRPLRNLCALCVLPPYPCPRIPSTQHGSLRQQSHRHNVFGVFVQGVDDFQTGFVFGAALQGVELCE